MEAIKRPSLPEQLWLSWNWKCALMSAVVRSLVYLLAMLHGGTHRSVAVVAVEMSYVTLTAGLWAGLQQRALRFRSRLAGNLTIVVLVPGLAQGFDVLAHHVTGATAPARATGAVCAFTLFSALFHLHVMRRGVFLTGHGCSLADDLRRIPRLVAGFVLRPLAVVSAAALKLLETMEQETAS